MSNKDNEVNRINRKIVLFGHFGENNLGDTILLVNAVRLLQNLDRPLCILSADPNNTRNNLTKNNVSLENINVIYSGRHGISDPSVGGVTKFAWIIKHIKEIFNCGSILIGPGTILQDKTHKLFIFFWFSRILIAKIAGKDFGLLGVGVGEVHHWASKQMLKYIGKNAVFTITRDRTSKEILLMDFGFDTKRIYDLVDLSYLEINKLENNKYKDPEKKNNGLHVGINFRNLEDKHLSGNKNQMEKYTKTIVDFTKKLRAELKMETISFFSMCSEGGQSDLPIYQMLNNEFSKTDLGNINLVDTAQDISSFEDELEKMDFFVGTRLHSIVLSTKLSIPTLAIAYSEKVEYYMDQLDCGYLSIPLEKIELSEMIDKLEYMIYNKKTIQKNLISKTTKLKHKAYMYPIILRELMSD
jgi:polysaccharide pyruvyl transferase WcaK-like protein